MQKYCNRGGVENIVFNLHQKPSTNSLPLSETLEKAVGYRTVFIDETSKNRPSNESVETLPRHAFGHLSSLAFTHLGRLLAIVGFVLISLGVQAQKGSFAVQLKLKSFDCVTKKMVLQVQVKANNADSTFLMGDANYRFRYSTLQLANPKIVSQENFPDTSGGNTTSPYQTQNLEGSTAGPTNGVVSLNTVFGGSALAAKRVSTDWLTVSCLQFDLLSLASCYTLTWQKDTDFPKTGMNEIILNGSAYTTKNVKSAKFFGNLTVCPDQYCATGKGKYGVKLSLKSYNCDTKKAVLRVEVRAADVNSTFLMGDANYRFNYSSKLLTNPQIVSQEGFSSVAPASDGRYTAQDLNGSTENVNSGIVSLNTKFNASFTGSGPKARTVGVDWITVSCISMDYKGTDTNPCFDLNWQTGIDFPPTGMNEVLFVDNKYTSADLPNGVEYAKATICPAQLCTDKSVDLSLTKKRTSVAQATVGSTATFRLVVKNDGPDTATNVVVTDSLPVGLQWVNSTPTLNPSGGGKVITWTIPKLASGDSAILLINTLIVTDGVHFNKAEITATDQEDLDSTPNNGLPNEDDMANACVSVPVKLCANQQVIVSVPSYYTNVKWFKGTALAGTGNTINLDQAGTYNISADAGSCPAEGCCPIIIEVGDCCPENICVPFTIKRTFVAGKPVK
jgi:uncharacterized repeat protein (TIGR01451 family)